MLSFLVYSSHWCLFSVSYLEFIIIDIQVMSDSLRPKDCSLPGSSVREILQARMVGIGSHSLFQGDLPNPGIKPGSPTLQADCLPSKPPGKHHNWSLASFFFFFLSSLHVSVLRLYIKRSIPQDSRNSFCVTHFYLHFLGTALIALYIYIYIYKIFISIFNVIQSRLTTHIIFLVIIL